MWSKCCPNQQNFSDFWVFEFDLRFVLYIVVSRWNDWDRYRTHFLVIIYPYAKLIEQCWIIWYYIQIIWPMPGFKIGFSFLWYFFNFVTCRWNFGFGSIWLFLHPFFVFIVVAHRNKKINPWKDYNRQRPGPSDDDNLYNAGFTSILKRMMIKPCSFYTFSRTHP